MISFFINLPIISIDSLQVLPVNLVKRTRVNACPHARRLLTSLASSGWCLLAAVGFALPARLPVRMSACPPACLSVRWSVGSLARLHIHNFELDLSIAHLGHENA